MSKIKKKEIYVLELSKDFYIEAENNADDECYDIWLCRKGYGKKIYMHGLLYEYYKSIYAAIRFMDALIDGWDYLTCYIEDLLDSGEEVDEHCNIVK